jgi:hypothetical protein
MLGNPGLLAIPSGVVRNFAGDKLCLDPPLRSVEP